MCALLYDKKDNQNKFDHFLVHAKVVLFHKFIFVYLVYFTYAVADDTKKLTFQARGHFHIGIL